MITKPISIPINLLGPGSQPERSVANTIGVPDIVDTFRQPYTPEVANKATAEKCRQFFIDLYEEMRLWNMMAKDANGDLTGLAPKSMGEDGQRRGRAGRGEERRGQRDPGT